MPWQTWQGYPQLPKKTVAYPCSPVSEWQGAVCSVLRFLNLSCQRAITA